MLDGQHIEEALSEYMKLERETLFEQLNRLEREALEPDEREAIRADILARLDVLREERRRMAGYFAEQIAFIDEANTRLKEIDRISRQGKRLIQSAPTNAQIDYAEQVRDHFAQGISGYKVFWVFFIGCFAGVIIEQLWAFVRYGVFEPRVGLVYGPFNLVYGLGAAALTAALYPMRNRTKLLSFLGGALIGSAVEYACSLFQEMVFGSVSWDYSNRPFNLNGRICLLYSIYWGALGVLWIKELYPRLAAWILRIPNRIGKPITIALAVFMALNTVMTGMCMLRWTQRRAGEAPDNRFEAYIDVHYPDERMQRLFSNLEFVDKEAENINPE